MSLSLLDIIILNCSLSASICDRKVFPSDHGASDTLSPADIADDYGKFDFSKNQLTSGAYAQVYWRTSNTQEEQSIEAIAFKRTNEQNIYYIKNLRTGKRIFSNKSDELPIIENMIKRVHELTEKEKRSLMSEKEMIFEWTPEGPFVMNKDNAIREKMTTKKREEKRTMKQKKERCEKI